jgi:hypothetical protein
VLFDRCRFACHSPRRVLALLRRLAHSAITHRAVRGIFWCQRPFAASVANFKSIQFEPFLIKYGFQMAGIYRFWKQAMWHDGLFHHTRPEFRFGAAPEIAGVRDSFGIILTNFRADWCCSIATIECQGAAVCDGQMRQCERRGGVSRTARTSRRAAVARICDSTWLAN